MVIILLGYRMNLLLFLIYACSFKFSAGAAFGEACTNNNNCTDTGQVCTTNSADNTCTCHTDNDYSNDGNKCVKDLGTFCTDATDCNYGENSVICDTNCKCNTASYYDNNGETVKGGACVAKHAFDESCTDPNSARTPYQCSTSNAVCQAVTGGEGVYKCQCNDGYQYIGSTCVQEDSPVNPDNATWSDWSSWSSCDVTCGSGSRTRTRTCPVSGSCPGDASETDTCNAGACPVNGNWGEWLSWGACSPTCSDNDGIQTRTRACNNPPPSNGGNNCDGDGTETRPCPVNQCSVDGNWGYWSSWGACSLTCGDNAGTQTRSRACDSPAPSYGGQPCAGSNSGSQSCSVNKCPVDGGFTQWSSWTFCSVTCAGGSQSRTRSCTNPSPQYGGAQCSGATADTKSCNPQDCPVDGNWGDWLSWGACSPTCGYNAGTQTRSRICDNPAPSDGGQSCSGSNTETQSCSVNKCPVQGGFTQWSLWTKCPVTCAGGSQSRTRSCTNPVPQYGGAPCSGSASDSKSCNVQACPVFGPPNDFQATEVTSRNISIRWREPINLYSGDIFGYVIQLRQKSTCVEEIVYKCLLSSCSTAFESAELEHMCDISKRNVISVSESQLRGLQSYTFSNIMPDTTYNVIGAAVTSLGTGNTADITITTEEEAPQRPYNVLIKNIKTTSFTVTWDIADPRPGKTNYTLILTADSPAESNDFIGTGFTWRTYNALGLEEYWYYSVLVTAITSKGSISSYKTGKYRTLPTAPGKVSNFVVITNPGGNYTRMKISWQAPDILQHNSVIKSYNFMYFPEQERESAVGKTFDHQFSQDYHYEIVVDVVPEQSYTFEVFAINEQNVTGEKYIETKSAPARVSADNNDVKSESQTTTVIVGVVLGVIIIVLSIYALYATVVIRRYKQKTDKQEIAKQPNSKGPIYVNESFMTGVSEMGEQPNIVSSNIQATSANLEPEYLRLDERTREDKETYESINCL